MPKETTGFSTVRSLLEEMERLDREMSSIKEAKHDIGAGALQGLGDGRLEQDLIEGKNAMWKQRFEERMDRTIKKEHGLER